MSSVEALTRGASVPVDPVRIERELAEAWRAASESPEPGRPVTRACLWNVVAVADLRAGEETACPSWLEGLIRGLPEHLAARALVLRLRPPGEPELRSWISANCIVASGGKKLVCSEEITLEARGAGLGHLPSLCRALLVPGLPTAVVLGEVPEAGDRLARDLVRLSDRVVTWASRCGRAQPYALARRASEQRVHVDLGWTAQEDLRSAVEALFDGAEAELDRVETVTATGPEGVLALGWVASRLGGAVEGGALQGDGVRLSTSRGPFRLVLDPEPDAVTVAFRGPGVFRQVVREPSGDLRLERPSGTRRWRVPGRSGSELLSRALLHRSKDAELDAAWDWVMRLRGTDDAARRR